MITFHRATSADTHPLVNSRLLFLEELGPPLLPSDREDLRARLEAYFYKSLEAGNCIAYLAYADGVYAGSGILVTREQPGNFKNPSGRVGYIMNMHTLPSFRRQGICTQLLEALKKEAQGLGIRAFELHSTEHGAPVYRKFGFTIHDEPTYRLYI